MGACAQMSSSLSRSLSLALSHTKARHRVEAVRAGSCRLLMCVMACRHNVMRVLTCVPDTPSRTCQREREGYCDLI